jgi:hypothetical protein
MRVATTIAQKVTGEWVTLALPEVDPGEQKIAFKKEVAANSGKYTQIRLMISKASDKRHTFRKPIGEVAEKKATKKK